MKTQVTCPICGGKTHVNRDTGDFTCDHCGKIVVRAMKNNFVPNLFEYSPIKQAVIVEAVNREIKNFIKEISQKGWIVEETKGGHQKAIWPHAPAGQQVEFFASTPSDPRAIDNIKSRIKRKMKQYPAPSDSDDSNSDSDGENDGDSDGDSE